MKLALLLYGQPRYIDASYELGWQHIIKEYKPDVYIHTWFDESMVGNQINHYMDNRKVSDVISADSMEKIVRLYKPTAFRYDPELDYETQMHPYTNNTEPIERAIYGQHESAYRAFKLIDPLKKYDLYIKSRMDIQLKLPRNMESFDKHTAYVPHHPEPDVMSPLMDQWAIGGIEPMRSMCMSTDTIHSLISSGTTLQSEFILHMNLVLNGHRIYRLPFKANFIRDLV